MRAIIRHISVSRLELLKQALTLVVDFVWRRIPCEHVRVEVFHFVNEQGQMKVDPFVKECYAKMGFRWKMLTNDKATGRRAQVMQLMKPKEGCPEFDNSRKIDVK